MARLDLEWHEPTTVEATCDLLASLGEDGKVLAGGTWVTMVLRQGLLAPRALVSLRKVPGLAGIAVTPDGSLSIGSRVTLREAERSPVVQAGWPVLAETYRVVANVRVRCQATICGNLCDADYASDPPATLAALAAAVVARNAGGERMIPVRDFILGHYETVLASDELVTAVIVPPLAPRAAGVYLKYRSRSQEDRPCVGVAAVAQVGEDGTCQDLQVVVGAVASTPQRIPAATTPAHGRRLTPEVAQQVARGYADAIEPLSDLRGSAWYRTRMIEVWVRRAILAAAERAASRAAGDRRG